MYNGGDDCGKVGVGEESDEMTVILLLMVIMCDDSDGEYRCVATEDGDKGSAVADRDGEISDKESVNSFLRQR